MQWMTGNGFTGHLRVCQCDARLLQKSAAHEFACLCACMSVYAFGRGYRDTFLEFPRLRSHLHPPNKSKCPASLSMRWPGLCHNRICLVWGRGCPGCRPCPRCPRPHPLLLPLTSRPESGPPRLRLPTHHRCHRFLPTCHPIQTSQSGLWRYVLGSGRSPQEHLRRELSPVRYFCFAQKMHHIKQVKCMDPFHRLHMTCIHSYKHHKSSNVFLDFIFNLNIFTTLYFDIFSWHKITEN